LFSGVSEPTGNGMSSVGQAKPFDIPKREVWVTSVNMVEIRVAAEAAKSLAASVDSGQGSDRWAAVVDGTPDCASVRGTAVKPCAFGAPLRGCGA
jgi:hypothetical protein